MIARSALALVFAAGLHAAAQPDLLSIKVQDRPLADLLDQIARQCDAGLLVHGSVADQLGEKLTLVTAKTPWTDVADLLRLRYGLSLAVEGGRLVVSDAVAALRARMVWRRYAVRHLLGARSAHRGPSLEIPDPGGSGSRLLAAITADVPEDVADVKRLIQRLVVPTSWEYGTIDEFAGDLVINQLPEVHERIGQLLERLERVDARQLVVRVHAIPAATAGPVLTAEQWRPLASSAVVAAFTTMDQQQNHHASLVQRLVIGDADVIQKRIDPITSVIADGLVVEIAPNVTLDGVLATVRFAATRAPVDAQTVMVRDDAGAELLPVDLPQSSRLEVADTRLVPFGGAAVYRCADRAWAVAFEVLDEAKAAEAAPATR